MNLTEKYNECSIRRMDPHPAAQWMGYAGGRSFSLDLSLYKFPLYPASEKEETQQFQASS